MIDDKVVDCIIILGMLTAITYITAHILVFG